MHKIEIGIAAWLLAWSLACAGPAEQAPAALAPSAPPGPPVLGAITDFEFEGAGCGCPSPTGIGSAYLSDGTEMVMHIDGADRHLTRISEGTKGKHRTERYAADGYTIDMVWKTVSEMEGGASYDVALRVTQGERPALSTTLSCGCGC